MENNEPNKREFELAEEFAERLRFMKSHGGYSLQEEAAAILSEYRAELLAPDREAADMLGAIVIDLVSHGEYVKMMGEIQAALTAARRDEREKIEAKTAKHIALYKDATEARVKALEEAARDFITEVENHCIVNYEGNAKARIKAYERFEVVRDALAALLEEVED